MAKAKFMKKSSLIKQAAQVLQRRLSYSKLGDFDEDLVPGDVKEGHFVVLAVRGEKPARFVISLRCLSHPVFLKLLALAEEEFGFRHEGPIALPCRPSELERIIKML